MGKTLQALCEAAAGGASDRGGCRDSLDHGPWSGSDGGPSGRRVPVTGEFWSRVRMLGVRSEVRQRSNMTMPLRMTAFRDLRVNRRSQRSS